MAMTKEEVKFKDADKKLAVVTITIDKGRLSMSGEYDGGFGQCDGRIKPKNDAQKRLLKIWDEWHLNDCTNKGKLPKDIESTLSSILTEIREIEDEDKRGSLMSVLIEEANGEILPVEELNELQEIFDGCDIPYIIALALHEELTLGEAEEITRDDGCRTEYAGRDYLVCTDDEADELWDEALDNYIDDCLEIPKGMEGYFDRDAWKSDARVDGRGHSLNHYDGGEECVEVDGEDYYIYRQ